MTNFFNLPTELINQIASELSFNTLLSLRITCHLLNDEITPQMWRYFLAPEFKKTSDPRKTFYKNINHVLPCFWHLHPEGVKPYKTLKTILNTPRWTPTRKLYEMQKMSQTNPIVAMMTVAQPTIKKAVLEALFIDYLDDGVPSMAFSLFKDILRLGPNIVMVALQSTEFKDAFLSNSYILANPYRAIDFLRSIAHDYHVITQEEMQWTNSIDINTEFENTFLYLCDFILNALLAEEHASKNTEAFNNNLSRS